jgi:serine/threonine protein kinase/tetratricopeptide (TPR) repeat protein
VTADPRVVLQAALVERYAIERELGRGGMATVYLARDLRHDRPVALKELHPELAAALGPDRFQREIRFAARLQHPHILTVHDSGDVPRTEGPPLLWFTMPFVEGESLRERIRRERQLPVEDALRIAREAAQALQYAHDHDVVHRDIKPENLLLTRDGNTLVADFGIARALGGDDPKLTETGLSVGTPAYMSPEQAAGDRGVDARTDVYSLGAVLYEMLAGEPPYTGATTQALLAKRFTEPPPNVRAVRSSVPESVDAAIRKALAPTAADRFSSIAQLAQALQGGPPATTTTSPAPPAPARHRKVPVTAGALVLGFLIGLGVLFGWLRRHGSELPDTGGPRRLAVLPFQNLGSAEDEYFADGVTDAVRGKLTALPGLQVTASNSSGQYKGTAKSARQIGEELGVDYLLVGTVRWEKGASGASRVRVSPELIQVASSAAKWQEPFDASVTDVFQVQTDIAGRVAEALDVALGTAERRTLAARPTASLEAYDAFLTGEEVSARMSTVDPVAVRRAAGYYEQAVALDSGFALAWAQLSRAYSNLYNTGGLEGGRLARAAAERALALGEGAAGHMAMGDYYGAVAGDISRALEEYAAGRRVAPNDAELLAAAALTEQSAGQWEESLQHLEQASRIDPRSVLTARRLTRAYLFLRRYPEAREAGERALRIAPTSLDVIESSAMVFLAQGDLPGARAVLTAAASRVETTALVAFMATYWDLYWVLDPDQQALLLRLTPRPFDNSRAAWGLALAQTHALRGDRNHARAYADSARMALEEAMRATPEDGQIRVLLGVALAYMGRTREAIAEGERGLALRPISVDAYSGAYNQLQLARIYILAGEPEKAMDQLEPLLRVPYYLSPGWLRIDPTFDPLRRHPRFLRLVGAGESP